jgi:DNA-binding response OmpR family regulator
MATRSTLLCIHRDPAQLSSLQEQGYELLTATNGPDGLSLFKSQHVDAMVLEYGLGLLDGAIIAAEVKKIKPHLPIVMLADHLEVPVADLKSIDALVAKSDGAHILFATIHFMLSARSAQQLDKNLTTQTRRRLSDARDSGEGALDMKANPCAAAVELRDVPFSRSVWLSIWNGNIQF